jgi:hypothetical protein
MRKNGMSRRTLGDAERAELAALEKQAGTPVDITDIREISDEQWRLALRGNRHWAIKNSAQSEP